KRRAVSAVMRRRLFTISVIRFGEIPTALASWFCESSYSARNSSFSISPGVTGANSFSTMAISSSVIIHDPDLMWLTVEPFEDDSPLIIDPDGVEILEITLQFFQPIRPRYREVF